MASRGWLEAGVGSENGSLTQNGTFFRENLTQTKMVEKMGIQQNGSLSNFFVRSSRNGSYHLVKRVLYQGGCRIYIFKLENKKNKNIYF